MKIFFSKLKRDGDFRAKVLAIIVGKLLVIFLIAAVFIGNREFVYYDALLLILVAGAYVLHHRIHLDTSLLYLISLIFIMHAAGGVVYVNGVRLYDMTFAFIHYDKIVHFLGSFTTVLVVYSFLHRMIGRAWDRHAALAFFLIVIVTAGLGSVWEITEFTAVLFFNASSGVGTYANNAMDLVVNVLGAIAGAFLVLRYHKKHLI